jgi:hypothetical protein
MYEIIGIILIAVPVLFFLLCFICQFINYIQKMRDVGRLKDLIENIIIMFMWASIVAGIGILLYNRHTTTPTISHITHRCPQTCISRKH